jgi:ankyrin repeat protein
MVETLLENKADVNQRSKQELTPLHIACRKGHVDVVKLLIKYDVDVNLSTGTQFVVTSVLKVLLRPRQHCV